MDCGLCSLGSRYGFAPASALLVLIAASSLPACGTPTSNDDEGSAETQSGNDGEMGVTGGTGAASGGDGDAGNADPCEGEFGCECDADETCAGSLECTDGVCVPAGARWIPTGPVNPGEEGSLADLPGYAIDETEVSAGAYAACMDAGMCTTANEYCPIELLSPEAMFEYADRPVRCVSWWQAVEYCAFVGGELPSSTQWLKAAQGTGKSLYPWGDTPDPACPAVTLDTGEIDQPVYTNGCGGGTPTKLGAAEGDVSVYGVRDTLGNVTEWTGTDYPGDETEERKILRGANYTTPQTTGIQELALTNRHVRTPDFVARDVGFRCAYFPTEAP